MGYGAHRIELETNNPQAGFLVLSEIYYRGWEARVDGKRIPVERVNYAFRGVALPPANIGLSLCFLHTVSGMEQSIQELDWHSLSWVDYGTEAPLGFRNRVSH